MNKKKPLRLEDLLNAALAYAQEDLHYTTLVRSTALGRQSDNLREEARFGRGQDESPVSHQLYEQAARLHPPTDQTAAAAGARHDLAESFKELPSGIKVENLVRAEALYREALHSRERDRFPSRAAMTRASLASCLRQLAHEVHDPQREAACETESASLLKEAIAISERRGPVGWIEAVSYLNTLGNLQSQQELHDSAVATFNRAEQLRNRLCGLIELAEKDYARAQIPRLPEYKRLALELFLVHVQRDDALDMVLICSANARIARNKKDDRAYAKKLLYGVVGKVQGKFAERARLSLVSLLRSEGDATGAKEVLRSLNHAALPPDALPQIAHEHERLGQSEAALQVLHEAIEQAIKGRKEHVANYSADHLAVRAQIAAGVAARIYANDNRALAAFLTLERCAGFRYEESLRHFTWRPADRLTRALWERRWEYSTTAGILESLASHAAYVPTDKVIPLLQKIHEKLTAQRTDEPLRQPLHDEFSSSEILRDQIAGVCLALDPIADLNRRAKELTAVTLALDDLIEERDQDGYRRWHSDVYAYNERRLSGLLKEHPDQAFLRFSLREDLLVVCVFLDDEHLQSRAVSLPLPANLLALVTQLRDNPRPDSIDYAALTDSLASLDLSPVLPKRHMRRAVVLPSLWASFLPLAALGPPGMTLLDRFESVIWLQSTAGLIDRQDTYPPRSGTLIVVPEQTVAGNTTELHNVAFAEHYPAELRLQGDQATMNAVAAELPGAAVLAVYSHGQHEGESGPHLELVDGNMDTHFGSQRHWMGLERAELWGCQSGVNIPHDPLTPAVDEGFGFDATLLSYGVRTAIGTLWKVSELVTAYLVRSYRQALSAGADAATALARAQRSWRDHGVSLLTTNLLQSVDPAEGVHAFLREHGATLLVGEATVARLLGAGKPLQATELRPFLAWFRCPATWGGYRFLGAPGQLPRRAWTADDERQLTTTEVEELSSLEKKARQAAVEAKKEAAPRASAEQWSEHDLGTARKLADGERPTPKQALEVARRYQQRLLSAHEHNLLCGLSWLHELLSEPQLDGQWKARLSLEAAHMWLELAEGETVSPADLIWPHFPHPEALARARRLLQELPPEFELADCAAARARLAFLSHLHDDPPRHVGEWLSRDLPAFLMRSRAGLHPDAVRKAEEAVRTELIKHRTSLDRAVLATAPNLAEVAANAQGSRFEHRRAIAIACNILRAAPHELPELVAKILSCASDQLHQVSQVPLAEHCSLGRMDVAQLELRVLASPRNPALRLGIGPLGATDLVRMYQLHQRLLQLDLPSRAAASAEQNVGKVLGLIEDRIWDNYASLDRHIFWRSTGTLGHAYRVLLGNFIGGLAPDEAEMRDAAHTIACLQLACDLRVSLFRKAALFCFLPPMDGIEQLKDLWRLPLRREQIFRALLDVTLQRDSASRRDPFCTSVEQLAVGEQPTDFSGEILAGLLQVPRADATARTAAFTAVRLIDGITEQVLSTWDKLQSVAKRQTEASPLKDQSLLPGNYFDPRMNIKEWTDRLRLLPEGSAVLGVYVGYMDTIWCAACWNAGNGVRQKIARSAPDTANQVRCLLLELTTAATADKQHGPWMRLQKQLQPVIDEALGEAIGTGKLHLSILAPGTLRAMPWLGLRVQGVPLYKSCASVIHLPALGLPPAVPLQQKDGFPKTACWLAPCDPLEGQTQFGEATIATLRARIAPKWVLDIKDTTQRPPIVVRLLRGERVECFRFYGLDNPIRDTATVIGFYCGRGQLYTPMQLPMPLVYCQRAEVWAAAAGWSEMEFLARDDGDVVPGLAGALLSHGVAEVLDLAWPIPDLIKALVCEIYTSYCAVMDAHPAALLPLAIAQTEALLTDWYAHRQNFNSIAEALMWLDEHRQVFFAGLAAGPMEVVPFASITCKDASSLDAFLSDLCAPVHLAAFRYWGH